MNSEIRKKMRRGKKKKIVIPSIDFLNSGSTMLNLACTGNPYRCFAKGRYYFFVGDSGSGKTMLCLTCFAEACINEHFNDYRLIYDNVEDGALMDLAHFFGEQVEERLEPPQGTIDSPVFSKTIEDFYFSIDDALAGDRPFIYVLDSMDALDSIADQEKFKKQKKARRSNNKKEAGSFQMSKAKYNSTHMNAVVAGLRDTGSILIIICQTRANVGFGFETKTRAGGESLKFYSALEIWTKTVGKIYKTVRGNKQQIGIQCNCKLKKNRINGRERQIDIPLFHSTDVVIDDTGSCIDYLLKYKHWKKSGSSIVAKEFNQKMMYEKLIEYIEGSDARIDKLRRVTHKLWSNVEKASQVTRKKRY